MTVLHTPRLRLEPLADAHLPAMTAMNADPDVARYLRGRPETPEETREMVERVKQRWTALGYSWWALVDRQTGELAGAGCVQNLRREAAPEPDLACPLEIGWRLRRDRWGQGLASEAARAMAAFAFDTLRAPELYAVCVPENTASSNVMKRLGMRDLGVQTWYGQGLATYAVTAEEWRAREVAENHG